MQDAGDVALQIEVERQHQVVARPGRLALELADLLATDLDLVRAPPGDAAQILFVRLLDARRANVVVEAVALLLELIGIVGRDRAHVADDVRDQRAVGIAPRRLDADLHAGHVELVLGQAHDGIAVDVRGHRDRVERVVVLARLARVDDALDVVGRHAQLVGHADHDLGHAPFGHVGRGDRDHEDRRVGRQERFVAVVDHSALGRDDCLA